MTVPTVLDSVVPIRQKRDHLKPYCMVDHYFIMVKLPYDVTWPCYLGANDGGHNPFLFPTCHKI